MVRKTAGLKDGALAGNRLGFRGTEDLGGGTAAVFWLESGISPSTGSLLNERDGGAGHVAVERRTQTTRQAYVGLKNTNLGEVRLGYQNTLNYDLTSQRHGLSIYPESRGGEAHNYTIAYGSRATAATYFSPKIANIEFSAQWASASDAGLNTAGIYDSAANAQYKADILALGAIYKNGPLQVGLVTSQIKVTGASPVATSQYVLAASVDNAAITNTAERKLSNNMLAARYNFGAFELSANYSSGKADGTTTAKAATANVKSTELGIKVPVGATDLIASYGTGKNDAATIAAGQTDIKYVGVGLIQNLSKRTRAYVLYGTQKDSAQTAATVAANLSGTRIGVSHAF